MRVGQEEVSIRVPGQALRLVEARGDLNHGRGAGDVAGAVGHNLVDRALAGVVGIGDEDIASAIDGHTPRLAEAAEAVGVAHDVAQVKDVGIRGELAVAVSLDLVDGMAAIIRHKKIAAAVEGQSFGPA